MTMARIKFWAKLDLLEIHLLFIAIKNVELWLHSDKQVE